MSITLIVRLRSQGIERVVVMATDNGFWVHILGCVGQRGIAGCGGVFDGSSSHLLNYISSFGRTLSIPALHFSFLLMKSAQNYVIEYPTDVDGNIFANLFSVR